MTKTTFPRSVRNQVWHMIHLAIVMGLFWLAGYTGLSAQRLPRIFVAPDIDTNYIDLGRDTWSVRAFSSYKSLSFRVRDAQLGETIKYRPNNLIGVGIGFAYRYILIDIGFGLKLEKDTPTERFSLQTNVLLKQKHLVDYTLEVYKGYSHDARGGTIRDFRPDIRSLATGINYQYNFSNRRLSLRGLYRGDMIQKKSWGGPMLGGLAYWNRIKADSNIVPIELRDSVDSSIALIQNDLITIGLQGGVSGTWVLPFNLSLSGSILPGFGFSVIRRSTAEEDSGWQVRPSGQLYMRSVLHYGHPRFFISLSYQLQWVRPSLTQINDYYYRYGVGKGKLVFGWRINSTSPLLEKANQMFE